MFNEKVMYKDRQGASEVAASVPEIVELDISNSGGSKEAQTNQEVVWDEPQTPPVLLRRSTRQRGSPNRYSPSNYYLLLTDSGEPESYVEASQSEQMSKWKLTMDNEMDSLMTNETWDLVELRNGKKALHNN